MKTDLISAAVPLAPGAEELPGGVVPQKVSLDALLTEYYLAGLAALRRTEALRQAGRQEAATETLAQRQLETLRLEEQAHYVRTQQELLRARPNYNDPELLRRQVETLARSM